MPCQLCSRDLPAEALHAALRKRYLNPRGYGQPLAVPRVVWGALRSCLA